MEEKIPYRITYKFQFENGKTKQFDILLDPDTIEADLVLDFTKHPDLSHDLALMCRKRNIPVVASGKKTRVEGVITPPT